MCGSVLTARTFGCGEFDVVDGRRVVEDVAEYIVEGGRSCGLFDGMRRLIATMLRGGLSGGTGVMGRFADW